MRNENIEQSVIILSIMRHDTCMIIIMHNIKSVVAKLCTLSLYGASSIKLVEAPKMQQTSRRLPKVLFSRKYI